MPYIALNQVFPGALSFRVLRHQRVYQVTLLRNFL